MSEIQIKQGTIIYEKDNALTMLSIIMEGTVYVKLSNETVALKPGDVIGVVDLYTGTHSCTYLAATDVVVDSYPYKTLDSLGTIYEQDDSFAQSFVTSALKQFFSTADIFRSNIHTCDSLYSALMEYQRDYTKLCKLHHIPAKSLPGLEACQPLLLEYKPAEHITGYYQDLQKICEETSSSSIFSKTAFISGTLLGISEDIHLFLEANSEMHEYLYQLSNLLMNEEKIDFVDLYVSLLTQAAHKGADTIPLAATISRMFIRLKNISSIPSHLHKQRFDEYRKLSQTLTESAALQKETPSNGFGETTDKLKDSLAVLMQFADMDSEFCSQFTADINEYIEIVDKTAVSAELSALRGRITRNFFKLYKQAFLASLKQDNLPEIVQMFFYFGYVDERLCGIENSVHLYRFLSDCHSDPDSQVYLFYDWLRLIYSGQKQPRRDEFDQDYPAYVQTLVNDGKISKEEASALLEDTESKVIFELDNMFTTAVKMTYGRLQTYCPVLSEHDFIKTPYESLLNPSKIRSAFKRITDIDYSAFCREVMFTDPCLSNGRELVQREILPDVILLPNVGIRAALWQEIEGRNRSTPGCMLFPIFCLTDIDQLAMRLTGEFRWEMCKRMQGSRWNDVSIHSLTSEYFDYLQFYKKNKELSTEAKEKCRQQLMRVKNRFREAFILDYISWLTYEAKGTPHMNKVTRKIFMTYCPFSAPYREALGKNPFYSAMLEKYDIQKSRELTRINGVINRIRRIGKPVPDAIEQQLAFIKK